MKPLKSPRLAAPQKPRFSRSGNGHGQPSSPSANVSMDPNEEKTGAEPKRKAKEAPISSPQQMLHQKTKTLPSQDTQGLDVMRRRMGEALAKKQEQRTTSKSPPAADRTEFTSLSADASTVGDQALGTDTSDALPPESGTLSTDSVRTIKASFDMTPGSVRTPSYPFPRMNTRLARGLSSRSGPHHRPFTLLSPTNDPPTMGPQVGNDRPIPQSSSEVSTPMGPEDIGPNVPDYPGYPTPDLYDMVLMLNTEPGLDSWWANLSEILAEAYGAERASLALPGDITDLENVPWGQKASFSIFGSDSGDSLVFDSYTASDVDLQSTGRAQILPTIDKSQASSIRPPLTSRHSIAGVMPQVAPISTRQRPSGPVRAISTASGTGNVDERQRLPFAPRLTMQSSSTQTEPSLTEEPVNVPHLSDPVGSAISVPRCAVYKSLQPLETEPDALLVRTGVASLFGQRKPIVLTRAYSENTSETSQSEAFTKPPDHFQSTGSASRERERSLTTVRAFDEYEQPEPSPWTQSPSPSPAARPDPAESPFFAQIADVDEDAFAQNPPPHDYGASANQSLSAIGVDHAKTLIHIPLIQPVPSRNILPSSLRFPVAILSFLTPINPYPRNLRHSLHSLLPHLASTFTIAHQYSLLQIRLRGASLRQGATFGLGGTFSDEGSELELVNELSTQLQQERAMSKGSSLAGSLYSPSEKVSTLRESPPSSISGTPFLDQVGLTTDFPITPGKSGSGMVDSYFSAKRNRSGLFPPGSRAGQVVTPGLRSATDESPERSRKQEKSTVVSRNSLKKASIPTPREQSLDLAQSPGVRSVSLTSESSPDLAGAAGFERADMIHRRSMHRDSLKPDDLEKPLPELIATLMLNAVPLQLFLAKPTSGDLVWTNRKFDAFRSQGEGRVRDPWKNVHDSDRPELVQTWNEALKTGSQFTHYIRIKRFNSDSDFRWFVFRASTMLSNDGRLLYWIGSYLDVHEQYMKNLEAQEMEATMARDAKLRALADAIPQVLFEALEGEGIVSVNQQWHTYSGQSLDEARSLGFARHVHREDLHKCGMLSPQDISRVKSDSGSSSASSGKTAQMPLPRPRSLFAPDDSSLAAMIKEGAMTAERDENGRVSYTTEIRLRSRGGEFRWFLVRLVKVQNEMLRTGHASWYGTCTDIETRMSLEHKLNEANKKVNSEMESKTKFFANMSHEIRTPLNGILGSMPWLVESQLDHDQRRTVDMVQNSANNLRELVDNILDVTKVEAGKMTLLPKWFHVRSLCEEVVDTCSSRAIERGLELNYTLDADVPATVKGDPFRVRQILLNLMGNSVKFTEQGEVFLRCTLSHDSRPGNPNITEAFLNFDVMDTGRGFNEAEFQRLFKQFGQIEGASQHDAGSGLGLFLSKQLVEMHGGQLTVTSKAGEGSTFSFHIRVEVTPRGSEIMSPEHPVSARPGHRHSVSYSNTSQSRTPTIASTKSIVYTPGLSKYTSPETQSPITASPGMMSPADPSDSSQISAPSSSPNLVSTSSITSSMPTPESVVNAAKKSSPTVTDGARPNALTKTASLPLLQRARSENNASAFGVEMAHPQIYSIVVICPAEHARAAIKQHIEHVVPHQIPVNVTTLKDIGSFLELRSSPSPPNFTHIVLDVPASSDVMLFIRQMAIFTTPVAPSLVIITDHYQKRDIMEDFATLTSTGRRAFLVHKPVKPSVVAMIFDPEQLRKLSKDRAREVAQSSSDNFKNIANQVKDKIGNKTFRLLLVEDSETNRMVIQRYLRRVGLQNEEARDGQECVDKVTSRPHGYYSLIICDIQMPRKNGYEACTEIREWERRNMFTAMPIMALTANAMPEERAAAGAAGFTDYLTKPVDFNRLGQLMMRLLDPGMPHVFLKDQPAEQDKNG